VSAKVDYAIRALVALARIAPSSMKGDQLAREEDIPFRFLEVTLGELRHAGFVDSRRGADGGYWLARPADAVTLEEIMLTIEGAIMDVRSVPPDELEDRAAHDTIRQLLGVWDQAEGGLRELLRSVTLAQLAESPATQDT
jgi:Rrf2 family protein